MILKEVQVVAPVGTSFGTLKAENGVLVIVLKPPGAAEWPHGIEPDGGFNTIEEGFTRYCVCGDEEPVEEPKEQPQEPPCPPSAS